MCNCSTAICNLDSDALQVDTSRSNSDTRPRKRCASAAASVVAAVGWEEEVTAARSARNATANDSKLQRRRHRNQRQAKPTTVDVSLSLNDLYTGKEKTATINRQTVCAGDKSTCQTGVCRGRQVQVHAVRDMWSGAIDRTFYCRYSTKVVGFVPPGTGHGEQIYVEEQGNIQPNMVQGDVVFQIHQLSHRTYKREGRNLQTSIRITLKEALLGWEKTLHHLDARTFVVASKRAHTTQPGEVLVVSNQGMPVRTGRAGQHGDLLVTVNVDFPKTTILEEDIIERIEEVFE